MPGRDEPSAIGIWQSFLRDLRSRRVRVVDGSMAPTLLPGDRLRVDVRAYRSRAPLPGDIVVVRDPEMPARLLVKRVARSDPSGPAGWMVYLTGDDPSVSRDSRLFGAVPLSSLIGRVYRRYYPDARRAQF